MIYTGHPLADRIFNFEMTNADAEALFQQLTAGYTQHLTSSMKWLVKGNEEMVDYSNALAEENLRLVELVMAGMSDKVVADDSIK